MKSKKQILKKKSKKYSVLKKLKKRFEARKTILTGEQQKARKILRTTLVTVIVTVIIISGVLCTLSGAGYFKSTVIIYGEIYGLVEGETIHLYVDDKIVATTDTQYTSYKLPSYQVVEVYSTFLFKSIKLTPGEHKFQIMGETGLSSQIVSKNITYGYNDLEIDFQMPTGYVEVYGCNRGIASEDIVLFVDGVRVWSSWVKSGYEYSITLKLVKGTHTIEIRDGSSYYYSTLLNSTTVSVQENAELSLELNFGTGCSITVFGYNHGKYSKTIYLFIDGTYKESLTVSGGDTYMFSEQFVTPGSHTVFIKDGRYYDANILASTIVYVEEGEAISVRLDFGGYATVTVWGYNYNPYRECVYLYIDDVYQSGRYVDAGDTYSFTEDIAPGTHTIEIKDEDMTTLNSTVITISAQESKNIRLDFGATAYLTILITYYGASTSYKTVYLVIDDEYTNITLYIRGGASHTISAHPTTTGEHVVQLLDSNYRVINSTRVFLKKDETTTIRLNFGEGGFICVWGYNRAGTSKYIYLYVDNIYTEQYKLVEASSTYSFEKFYVRAGIHTIQIRDDWDNIVNQIMIEINICELKNVRLDFG